jgi:ABC-type polysaccharide/polyol phosphate export permease
MTAPGRRPRALLELIWSLALRQLYGRYIGSAMGIFWTVVHPLIMLAVWTFVFSYILKLPFSSDGGLVNSAFYLFCGLVPFLSFQETVQNCTTSITGNAALVKNLVFPSKTLQFSVGLASLISEFIGIGILVAALVLTRFQFPIYLPLILPFALLLMLFGIGLGFITCSLHVFFRDVAQLVNVMLMLWLYATPIFYPVHLLPRNLEFMIYVNPLAYVTNVYRSLLLVGTLPSLRGFLVFCAISLGTFVLGYRTYTRFFPRFIDEL